MGRHALKRVVTVAFYALIRPENHPLEQKINVTEIKWFALNKLPKTIGFDHKFIIANAHKLPMQNLQHHMIFGELLPKKFTLHKLQTLYEVILEERFDKRNFCKKIAQLDILENTGII